MNPLNWNSKAHYGPFDRCTAEPRVSPEHVLAVKAHRQARLALAASQIPQRTFEQVFAKSLRETEPSPRILSALRSSGNSLASVRQRFGKPSLAH